MDCDYCKHKIGELNAAQQQINAIQNRLFSLMRDVEAIKESATKRDDLWFEEACAEALARAAVV
jgi:hypothetical protein